MHVNLPMSPYSKHVFKKTLNISRGCADPAVFEVCRLPGHLHNLMAGSERCRTGRCSASSVWEINEETVLTGPTVFDPGKEQIGFSVNIHTFSRHFVMGKVEQEER